MLGAIVGDIIGSVYEWNNIKTKDFPLFRKDCFFTDDTVMTCAVAEAVMNGGKKDDFIDAMKKYGRMYPDAGYGIRFAGWLFSDNREPYNSFGNGSAMRVSPCGWVMNCGFYGRTGLAPYVGRNMAELSAAVTHNHPEGIKGGWQRPTPSSCAVFTLAAGPVTTRSPSMIIRQSAKSASGNTLRGNSDTTCPAHWMRSARRTGSMRPARIRCRRPSLRFWKAPVLKTPYGTRYPLAVTAIRWRPSPAV